MWMKDEKGIPMQMNTEGYLKDSAQIEDYESPIHMYIEEITTEIQKVGEKLDEECYNAVFHYGIDVDKAELIKALQYDRDQYSKGYARGYAAGQRDAYENDCSSDEIEAARKWFNEQPHSFATLEEAERDQECRAIINAALDKQTPKKPVRNEKSGKCYCPNCNSDDSLEFYYTAFCPDCGQALDWEE